MVLGDEWLEGIGPHVTHIPHVRLIPHTGADIQYFIDLLSRNFEDGHWQNVQIVILVLGAVDLRNITSEKVLLKYKALICIIRARLGDVIIVCCSLPPRLGLEFKTGLEFNKDIAKIASALSVEYFLLHRPFVCGKTAKPGYYESGMRMSRLGINVVVKMIKQYKVKLYM